MLDIIWIRVKIKILFTFGKIKNLIYAIFKIFKSWVTNLLKKDLICFKFDFIYNVSSKDWLNEHLSTQMRTTIL